MKKYYTVTQVEALCDTDHSTVIRWINNGLLKARRESDGYRAPFIIAAEDLDAFLASDNYPGHPKDFKACKFFNRIPILENCFPVNLIQTVLEFNPADKEAPIPEHDIWRIDFKKFKELFGKLSDRDQRVLIMRFQFGMTLDEIGAAIGVTRERVRQLQIHACIKLKRWIQHYECYVVPKSEYSELQEKYDKIETQLNTLLEDEKIKSVIEYYKGNDPVRFYTLKIEELDLNVRPYNCLKRAGIDTVGDIIAFDKYQAESHIPKKYRYDSWREIRNLGRKSLQEIAEKTYEFCNYRIRYYDPDNKCYTDYIPLSYMPLTPNVQELKL